MWLDKDAVLAPDGSVHFVDLEGIEDVEVERSKVRERIEDQIYRTLYELSFAYEQIEEERARRFGEGGTRKRHFEGILREAVRGDPFVRSESTPGPLEIVFLNKLQEPSFDVRFPAVDLDPITNCKDIYAFVSGVQARSTPPTIPPTDIQTLQQIQWIRYLTTDQFSSMAKEVEALSVDEEAFAQAQDARNRAGALLEDDTRKSHSILFHLEGQAKRDAVLQEEAQAQRSFQSADSDASARRQTVEDLIAKRSLLDTLTPGSGGDVAVTGLGAVETRRLSLGMYRFSDVDFASYWAVRQQVGRDPNDIADRGAQCVQALSTPLAKVDRSYLWSIAIGLAKRGTDLGAGMQAFLDAYNRIGGLSENEENRLMAAEIPPASRGASATRCRP